MKAFFKIKNLKILFCLSVIVLLISGIPTYKEAFQYVQKLSSSYFLVIDPGHGGFDGGAESSDGTCEKDINLQIAREIQLLAEADGWNVILTRNEDVSLSDDKGTIRSRKTRDLLERKRIISEVEPNVAISIHLNSFKEDSSVRGAQVFYPKECKTPALSEKCRKLAEAIQLSLTMGLADGTNRASLSKDGVLILKNVNCPIALVECGFLSNPAEAQLLKEKSYQKKLAKHIYEGVLNFTGKKTTKPLPIVVSN